MVKLAIWEAGLPLAVLPGEASRPAHVWDGRPCTTCDLGSLTVAGSVWGHPSCPALPHVTSEFTTPVCHLLCSCQTASPLSPFACDLLMCLPSLGTHLSQSVRAFDLIQGNFVNLSAHALLKGQTQIIF